MTSLRSGILDKSRRKPTKFVTVAYGTAHR